MADKPAKKMVRCPNCGHAPLREDKITDCFTHFTQDGAAISVEARDVPVEVCDKCGEKYIGPTGARVQNNAIYESLRLLTPETNVFPT